MFRNAVSALGPDHTDIREKTANAATTTVGVSSSRCYAYGASAALDGSNSKLRSPGIGLR